MAQGKKTPPEQVYKVMVSYIVTNNYEETARQLNMPPTTVEKLVKENKDKPEFVELWAKKREDFAAKATKIIDKAIKRLEKELDENDDIPVNHLTTVIGTMYDKRALASGESTQNQSITIKMDDSVKELAE